MSLSDTFLDAIVADPYSDTPRWIFADWLEEQGDSERAEFIRLQLEIAEEPQWQARKQERTAELLKAHKPQWEIPGISGGQFFRRGFVESLQMAAAEFVRHGERIGRQAPVLELRLPMANAYTELLREISWIERLDSLDLRANSGIADRLPPLFLNKSWGNLRYLNLQNCGLWPVDIGFLASVDMPRLETLTLSGNYLGDTGVEQLSQMERLQGLRKLVLRRDMIAYSDSVHGAGAASLASSPYLGRLRDLDLSHQYLGDSGFASLVGSPNLAMLETLDVSHNEIGAISDEWAHHLSHSPYLGRLKQLNLSGNTISRLALTELLAWRQLEKGIRLDLRRCEFDAAAMEAIRNSPYSDQIEHDQDHEIV